MATEVHCKSYIPGYHSMRDLNENSSNSSWPLFYGDKTLPNGHYYNGFMPRTVMDAYQGYDKDTLKQKMLEHEAIFKNQVYELHRLYRIQRDMMEEIKRKELYKQRISLEASSSSTLLAAQIPSEDARNWHIPSFPLANSGCARPSISGAEIINSPLSCTKGSSTQAGRVASQNGCTPKDCEVLESRPLEVKKKLFDLQLPADEYIDTEDEEQLQDNKTSEISSYPSTKNHRIGLENGVKLFLGGGKTDCQGDASTSDSGRRSCIGFADLNEPIQVEEVTVPASVDYLTCAACHGEINVPDLSAKPQSQFLGLSKEILWNSQRKGNTENMNSLSSGNIGTGREWLSYMHEEGNSKRNLDSGRQGLPQDKFLVPSHSVQLMLSKAHQPLGIFPTDHSREDRWRDRTGCGLEFSERSHEQSSYSYREPTVASHVTSPYPFVNSSDLVNSWSHSVSSWGKPCSSLTQKLTSVPMLPSANSSTTLNRSSQSSAQSYEIFREKWHVNGRSRSNLGLGSELPALNGYYHGSSSGSKELAHFPSTSVEYLNGNRNVNATSELSNDHGCERNFKSSNFMDSKPVKDLNLNVILPVDTSIEAVSQQDCEITDDKRKCEDHLAVLPWIRAKPACKNEATNTRSDSNPVELGYFQASCSQLVKNDTGKCSSQILTQAVSSASNKHDGRAKKKIGDNHGSRKILGYPIFDNFSRDKNDSSYLISSSAPLCCPSEGDMESGKKSRIIDINLACDQVIPEIGKPIVAEALAIEENMDKKFTRFRNEFDLNACITEDEEPLRPLVASTRADAKVVVEIDLEAPVVLESEDDILPDEDNKLNDTPPVSLRPKIEQPQDDVVRIAAEAIVSISSSVQHNNKMEDAICNSSEAAVADSLLWFAEISSSCANGLENILEKESRCTNVRDIGESLSGEMDYFEAMTLQLTETKEEEYMPKPLVPEIHDAEEVRAASLPSRPRKGPARRRRQRRDFQRDILPGLASLSRHEITEDLQTFGGLMRATGHPWNSGLTRRNGTRNGAARGRRRAVVDTTAPVVVTPICATLMQQLNNIEAGLVDRSLTGWGKTTRRPRRQRYPGGNPPPVPLA